MINKLKWVDKSGAELRHVLLGDYFIYSPVHTFVITAHRDCEEFNSLGTVHFFLNV